MSTYKIIFLHWNYLALPAGAGSALASALVRKDLIIYWSPTRAASLYATAARVMIMDQ